MPPSIEVICLVIRHAITNEVISIQTISSAESEVSLHYPPEGFRSAGGDELKELSISHLAKALSCFDADMRGRALVSYADWRFIRLDGTAALMPSIGNCIVSIESKIVDWNLL